MANPLEELSIFHISTPKSAQGERSIYGWITIKYTRNGTAMAYYNYQKQSCGRAGGYGYDKTGAALSSSIEKLTGIRTVDGASGVDAVVRDANAKNVTVIPLRELGPKY